MTKNELIAKKTAKMSQFWLYALLYSYKNA